QGTWKARDLPSYPHRSVHLDQDRQGLLDADYLERTEGPLPAIPLSGLAVSAGLRWGSGKEWSEPSSASLDRRVPALRGRPAEPGHLPPFEGRHPPGDLR